MFKKILIANRGEIACRIIKTAKKLNISTVAVYSVIDANALHVRLADEAYYLGPAPSTDSYLNQQRIIEIAQQSNVEAIHPGYGFLSERADFARRCIQAGICFVGPSPEAIELMGDKDLAKMTMEKAGVPVTSGYHGSDQDINALRTGAETLGFPLLVKASAGGGGKGMRKVTDPEHLISAIESAKREAKKSFGNDKIFLEKWIQQARHIEVQIMADSHGNVIDLFDRDCSVQRRHQKIIEEAPAVLISSTTREQMAKTAIKAAQTIHYCGAGTLEFLVDEAENFYFMEMNTRLQVEHPTTEMITGIDLVEWQLRIAAGECLPCSRQNINSKGHAIEARIYAEDPYNQFLPSSGNLIFYQIPTNQPNLRIDTGVENGDYISTYYDPMIAKVIVWSEERESAIRLLESCLKHIHIVGVKTNITFLSTLSKNPHFISGKIHTNFIDQHQTRLLANIFDVSPQMISLASLGILHWQQQIANQYALQSEDSQSPWFIYDNWRAYHPSHITLSLSLSQQNWNIRVTPQKEAGNTKDCYQLCWEQYQCLVKANWLDNNTLIATFNHEQLSATIVTHSDQIHVFYQDQHQIFTLKDLNPCSSITSHKEQGITAPMPGTLVQVLVKANQTVIKGDPLIVLESMKMEHTVSAPRNGVIKAIFYQTGDRVSEGDAVVELDGREV